ncbi:DUF4239 domain-containing protein [Kitasatospora sp. NPDC089797]|uniref:bestrophin-like domain n=1 Tax=Kitasatospora sp. NPDC089797 TaxID=3155298 RepID=UPI00342C2AC9
MGLWLLEHLPTVVLTVLVVGGVTAAAVAGSVLAHRRLPSLASGENNEMVGVVLGVFGAIYGIILAFVIVNLWTQLQDARHVVSAEATSISQVVRDTEAFPPSARTAVNDAVGSYVHAVVEQQWPLMRTGRGTFEATGQNVDAIYAALRAYEPRSQSQQAFYAKALDSLNDAVGQRRARIEASQEELPGLLWVLVVGGALVILLLALLYRVPGQAARMLFVSSVAALIGFSLLLVLVLDRPFVGDLSISPLPFQESSLARFW